jgi:hypothetical protein
MHTEPMIDAITQSTRSRLTSRALGRHNTIAGYSRCAFQRELLIARAATTGAECPGTFGGAPGERSAGGPIEPKRFDAINSI